MTRHICLTSNKGGQGITTTTLLLARSFEEQGLTVAVVDKDDGDLRAAMGVPYTDDPTYRVTDKVTWHRHGAVAEADVVIYDNCAPHANKSETYVVVRNCYLSIRRNMDTPGDGVIVISDSGRALTVSDVESVMRKPVVTVVPIDNAIVKKVDAGLFDRLPTKFTINPLVTS